jgi:hypothetical protein
MAMTSIRFTDTAKEYKAFAEEFLKSLKLDPSKWLDNQVIELSRPSRAIVFGMRSTIPYDVKAADTWYCRIDEDDGIIRFWLGERLWGAKLTRKCSSSSLKRLSNELHALSMAWISDDQMRQVCRFANLSSLHVERCRSLIDIQTLASLRNLSDLSLIGCDSLEDLRPLHTLEFLTDLLLFDCKSLSDIEPLAPLRELSNLVLHGCRSLQHVSPLKELEKLSCLTLTGCDRLENLHDLGSLVKLRTLELSRCLAVTSIRGLENLSELTRLKLHDCAALTDASPLAELSKLQGLLLSGRNIDLQALSKLINLKELRLLGCATIQDLSPLGGNTQLRSLDISSSPSLQSLSGIEGMSSMTDLILNHCSSLVDLKTLPSLPNLQSLDLFGCESLKDISSLVRITSLRRLNLNSCREIVDLNCLTFLPNLSDLSVMGCKARDLRIIIGRLKNLTKLDLTGCFVGSDLKFIDHLSGLKCLHLAGVEFSSSALTDISSLRKAPHLEYLDLSGRRHLEDIEPLSDMLHLKALKLFVGKSKDLDALSRLTALEELDLVGCDLVTDYGFLSTIRKLVKLELRCPKINDLGPICNLSSLTSLDIKGCEEIRTLEPLQGLHCLESISFSSRRIRSIDNLRGIQSLQKVDGFDPFETADLLACSAIARGDLAFIEEHSFSWLREANGAEVGLPLQERFATTLGEAFSLLGEHKIELSYEEYLQNRSGFSAAPWKAWLEGTQRESGLKLMLRRIERQDVSVATPGCIGGICVALPNDSAVDEDQAWGRNWLVRMEECWKDRSKELLPVCAEICLAHVRLGLTDSLGRWLHRFTDPSDPGALDSVHAALAKFELASQSPQAAEGHIFAIKSPSLRDPLLADLITSYVETSTDRASAHLLLIEAPLIRRELAKTLVALPAFSKSEIALHRLVVAMDDSPEALGELIASLPSSSAPSQLIKKISESLQLDREKTLRKIAEELHRKADRLLMEANLSH